MSNKKNTTTCLSKDQNGFYSFDTFDSTRAILPNGLYSIRNAGLKWGLVQKEIEHDGIINVPDDTGAKLVASIEKFLSSKERYQKYKLLYKRGYLLYGPAGGGKTISIIRFVESIVKNDGIAIYPENALNALPHILNNIRNSGDNRTILCIIEDVDSMVSSGTANQHLLSLLDGETQINNVVFIATTNHIEKLPSTLKNRPSRFDEVILVDSPSAEARSAYIQGVVPDISEAELQFFVDKTNGMMYAHIKELIVSVYCLGGDPEENFKRVQKMKARE